MFCEQLDYNLLFHPFLDYLAPVDNSSATLAR